MERIVLLIVCVAVGLVFLIFGGIGLIGNYKVVHSSSYIIVEGIGGFYRSPGRGSFPYIVFNYNGKEISKDLSTSNIKRGEKIRVYYNPAGKDVFLRVVDRIDNSLYIFLLLGSLPFFCVAVFVAFPEMFI